MREQDNTLPARTPLPEMLRSLFWEYEFDELSWEEDRDLVIGRVLASGDLDSLRWLRLRITNSELTEWLTKRHGAGLERKQLRFWELILGMPHALIDSWLMAPGRQVWDRRLGR